MFFVTTINRDSSCTSCKSNKRCLERTFRKSNGTSEHLFNSDTLLAYLTISVKTGVWLLNKISWKSS